METIKDILNFFFNDYIGEAIRKNLLEVFDWILKEIMNLATNVFEYEIIGYWFDTVSLVAKFCFFVGAILYIANIGINMSLGKRVLLAEDIKALVVYFGFAWFGIDGTIAIFVFVNKLVSTLTTTAITSDYKYFNGSSMAVNVLMIIIVTICLFSFLGCVVYRVGHLFMLLTTIPVYVLSVGSGRSSGFFSWLRLMAITSLAFVLQYVVFYFGLYFLINYSFVLSLVFFISVPLVEVSLARIGKSPVSLGNIMEDFSSAAKAGVSAVTTVAGGI